MTLWYGSLVLLQGLQELVKLPTKFQGGIHD